MPMNIMEWFMRRLSSLSSLGGTRRRFAIAMAGTAERKSRAGLVGRRDDLLRLRLARRRGRRLRHVLEGVVLGGEAEDQDDGCQDEAHPEDDVEGCRVGKVLAGGDGVAGDLHDVR